MKNNKKSIKSKLGHDSHCSLAREWIFETLISLDKDGLNFSSYWDICTYMELNHFNPAKLLTKEKERLKICCQVKFNQSESDAPLFSIDDHDLSLVSTPRRF